MIISNNSLKTSAIIFGTILGLGLIKFISKKVPLLLNNYKEMKYSIQFDENCYGGRIFAEALKNQGVKFIFTLTGGHIAPILVGCKEMGIRVIDVRHEVNTVFAADAVTRLTGIPGVAIVTAGPGLTNTITAVKNAQMAQSPVIIIAGATSDLLKGRGSLQDIDQIALIKPHVKWYIHIKKVKDIVSAVENAFYYAQEGVPGPVFIEVPLDILYKEKLTRSFYSNMIPKSKSVQNFFVTWYLNYTLNKIFSGLEEISFHVPLSYTIPLANEKQVNKVLNYLSKSKHPVLLLGSQAMLLTNEIMNGNLNEAVNKLGIPTSLSGMARGFLGRNCKFQIRQKETKKTALRECDLIILAGVVCDFRLDYGNSITKKAILISINRDKGDLYKNRTPTFAIHGDPGNFLLQLAKNFPMEFNNNWLEWKQKLYQIDNEKELKIENDIKSSLERKNEEAINPLYLCHEIEKIADPNCIFVADGGDFVGTASYILKPRNPLSWMDPGVFGTLGVGCGFAMGAKLCKPDNEVWIIFGDGACGFSLIEFDTFVRHNIPIIAVVGNDGAWMQMLRGQIEYFNDDTACILAHTNYEEVVKGFGAEGILVKHPEEIENSLKKAKEIALHLKKPVLVNVIIGKSNFRAGSLSM